MNDLAKLRDHVALIKRRINSDPVGRELMSAGLMAQFGYDVWDYLPRLLDDIEKIREENRKLREAVISERARYIWGHRKCEDEKVAFAVAERELRAEGVIE